MKAYAIQDPKGVIYIDSIKELKKDCINNFLSIGPDRYMYTWPQSYRYGWRCVKIEITLTHKTE